MAARRAAWLTLPPTTLAQGRCAVQTLRRGHAAEELGERREMDDAVRRGGVATHRSALSARRRRVSMEDHAFGHDDTTRVEAGPSVTVSGPAAGQ